MQSLLDFSDFLDYLARDASRKELEDMYEEWVEVKLADRRVCIPFSAPIHDALTEFINKAIEEY